MHIKLLIPTHENVIIIKMFLYLLVTCQVWKYLHPSYTMYSGYNDMWEKKKGRIQPPFTFNACKRACIEEPQM